MNGFFVWRIWLESFLGLKSKGVCFDLYIFNKKMNCIIFCVFYGLIIFYVLELEKEIKVKNFFCEWGFKVL